MKTRARCELDFPYFLRWCSLSTDDGVAPFSPYGYQEETARRWQGLFDAKETTSIKQGEIDLKPRQIGFSWLVAAFKYWVAAYHPSMHVGYSSFNEREVKYHFKFRLQFIHEHLREDLRQSASFTATTVEFGNGSTITGFPSTMTAGVSRTLRLHVMDEAAMHEYAQENYEAVTPAVMAGGMMLLLSTANPERGPSGFFYDMYWHAKRGAIVGYRSHFYPWYVRPPRHVVAEDGSIGPDYEWLAAETSQYASRPDMAAAWYPMTDVEAFVGRKGLVFPNGPPIKAAPCEWESYKWRIAGVDFGGGDPTAITPIGITGRQEFHQHDEFYSAKETNVEQIADYLFSWHQRAPFAFIECDPSQRVVIETLRSLGLPAEPANNRREGINIVRMLHDKGLFTISPHCAESIHEYDGYTWSTRRDPNSKAQYKTDTPVDHHGDAMDARRYALVAAWKRVPQSGEEKKRRGIFALVR